MPHKIPTEETLEKLFKVLQKITRGEVWPKKGLLKDKKIIFDEYTENKSESQQKEEKQ